MNRLILTLALCASFATAAAAQEVTTSTLTTELTPSAENPPVDTDASGKAVVAIHQVRDEDGVLTSAIVDFRIMWAFGQPETVRAMHIHRGAAGSNGPVVIGALFGDPLNAPAGSGSFLRTSGPITDPMRLETVQAVLDYPAGYYVNLHSVSSPPGIVRGNLRHADSMLLMTTVEKLSAVQASDAAQDDELALIKANVNAIARRLGIVPVE